MTTTNRIPDSELIVNEDGSIFHLHLRPEQISDKIIVCGDPGRVDMIASRFDSKECEVSSREFHTITGSYKGKRITALSHGIGGDNIEIVMNELDALANIDLEKRVVKQEHKSLTVVRVGTSGGLQEEDPVGAYVASEYSIGFDGVLHFYADEGKVCDKDFEQALLKGLDWKLTGLKPYVVRNDESLFRQITDGTDIIHGVTISANGFYVPQGRKVRSLPLDPDLNRKIMDFEYRGHKITNFEMEGSALAGIGAILGHRCLTICTIIAGRKKQDMNTSYKDTLSGLIDLVLDRI